MSGRRRLPWLLWSWPLVLAALLLAPLAGAQIGVQPGVQTSTAEPLPQTVPQTRDQAQAPAPTPALTGAQEARARHIGTNLRCPICTGIPITESPNDISREMLRDVRGQVAAGKSDREVYAYFAARYGNFVLLDPPKEGSNLLLWAAPLLALGAGGAVLWGFLRRRGPGAPGVGLAPNAAAPLTPLDPEPLDSEPFDSFLEQVKRDTRRAGTHSRRAP